MLLTREDLDVLINSHACESHNDGPVVGLRELIKSAIEANNEQARQQSDFVYAIKSIKYLAGELTLKVLDDGQVPSLLESGMSVTLKVN